MVWQIDKNIMWSVIKHLLDILTHVKILNNLNHLYIEHGVCVCVQCTKVIMNINTIYFLTL